jgi:hypothetical protein
MSAQDIALEYATKCGQFEGREIVRGINEKILKEHLAHARKDSRAGLYTKGYIAGIEYAIRCLEIK